jgi:hypothetical protein
MDPVTGQKVVIDAALADQINLRRDGKQIDAEIAAGIRYPDGSSRDIGAALGSVTVEDVSGRPPGDYLNPDRIETFSRSINEYWRQAFEAIDAGHLASVGHEYTDAPELRQAYADRDAYLAKLDAYSQQMVVDNILKPAALPALLATGAAAPYIAGTYFAGGTLAYFGTSASIGATANVAFTRLTKGSSATIGDYAGSVVFGGLGGTGFQFVNTGSRLLNSAGNGAMYGGLTELTGQTIDTHFGTIGPYDPYKIGFATGAGGLIGAASNRLDLSISGVNAGRNSYLSIYSGLNTRLSNGNISTFNPVYGVKGGFGQGIIGIPAAGLNAVVILTYPQQPNGK